MNEGQNAKLSKFLAYILRHKGIKMGLVMQKGGWFYIEDVLGVMNRDKPPTGPVTRKQLEEIVQNDEKQRYSIQNDLIRANQGHSFPVDLELQPMVPPPILYHGTHEKVQDLILKTGIKKMQRHHVHLSKDIPTAIIVGKRRGKPVVFSIDTAAMHAAGFTFYCSENGVWLVEEVPPQFIQVLALKS